MTPDTYQQETAKTAIYPKHHWDSYLFNGLASEVGEFLGKAAKAYRKDTVYPSYDAKVSPNVNEPNSFPTEAMFLELGDVMWFVSQLCNEFGWRLEEVMEGNIVKLKGRQERGTIEGSGDSR